MDHKRKKHWVKYHSDKCKMYLRNDFKYTCAYCGMKEWDNIAGEIVFEKDHFLAKSSKADVRLDDYDNMVYACCKCNRTKTDKNLYMILDPCQDDIYGGNKPHVKKLGAKGKYMLQALTPQGKAFIDSLHLNSRFYRKMREKQEQNDKIRQLICDLLEEHLPMNLPAMEELKNYWEENSYFHEKSDEFRCGFSKAGVDVFHVLKILDEKEIKYKLILEDYDLDVEIDFQGSTYSCEIKLNDYTGEYRKAPRVNIEKRSAWSGTGTKCGVLCYYKNTDILEFYLYGNKNQYKKYEL